MSVTSDRGDEKNQTDFKGTPNYQHILDFIYFGTIQILQLIQSNLLPKQFFVHKIQFISNKLHPSSSSHGQLHELVFLFLHRRSQNHTGNLTKALLFFSLITVVLVQSFNKIHMKFTLDNKFRMIFHDQKSLSLNFKSSHLQMFCKTHLENTCAGVTF